MASPYTNFYGGPVFGGGGSAIEELDFSKWTKLQELPERIGNIHSLRVINICNLDHQLGDLASIKELPDSLCSLPNLEELDIYGLQDLKQLPPSFAKLSRLNSLDTMYSGIEELHLVPEQWKNLEKLRLHGPLPVLRLCGNLKEFSWSNRSCGSDRDRAPYWTDEVISLPLSPLRKLELLWIIGGVLDSVAFLAFMPELRYLHLSCDFEGFPAGFEKLNKLEEIDIWEAKSLTTLPEYLGHIPSLKRLHLTRCGVESLPKSVLERKDLDIRIYDCPAKGPE